MHSMARLQICLGLLLLASMPACRRSGQGAANGAGKEEVVSARAPKADSDASEERNRSMLEELQAIKESAANPTEGVRKSREYMRGVAKERGLSLPQLIAGNLAELLQNPDDRGQRLRLTGLCSGERDEMIEFIQKLPAGPLRREAVTSYGGTFMEKRDLDAFKKIYESISPGTDRTILASLAAEGAFLSSKPDEALRWIEALEYPEEKRSAIGTVDSKFKQDLGTPADRAAYLSELQGIAKANGISPPTGKRGEPLSPLKGPAASQGEAPR